MSYTAIPSFRSTVRYASTSRRNTSFLPKRSSVTSFLWPGWKNGPLKARLNPVGGTATDLKLQTPEGSQKALSGVEAPYTILYFFNPGCEACQPVTERLVRIYNIFKTRGVEVYAVYLDRDRKVWTDYIATKGLAWINVFDPSGTEKVEEKYDIYAMPMIYLLDKDKKVIARDVSVERLPSLIQRLPATGK